MFYDSGYELKDLKLSHLVVASYIWHASKLAGQLVLHLVDGIVLYVDGSYQQVVGDVVQMAAELQPGPGSRDMISGALSLHLEKR